MIRNSYIRLTQFEVPPNTTAGQLRLLALVSKPVHIFEGMLISDVRVREAIRLQTIFYDGVAKRQRLGSSRVLRIEGGYALTKRSLFQFLRVPPYSQDKLHMA
jgi:hypothetical protein